MSTLKAGDQWPAVAGYSVALQFFKERLANEASLKKATGQTWCAEVHENAKPTHNQNDAHLPYISIYHYTSYI